MLGEQVSADIESITNQEWQEEDLRQRWTCRLCATSPRPTGIRAFLGPDTVLQPRYDTFEYQGVHEGTDTNDHFGGKRLRTVRSGVPDIQPEKVGMVAGARRLKWSQSQGWEAGLVEVDLKADTTH